MTKLESVENGFKSVTIDFKSLISHAVQLATAKGAVFDREPGVYHYIDETAQIIYNDLLKLIDISFVTPLDSQENSVFLMWDFRRNKLIHQLPGDSQERLYRYIMSLSVDEEIF